MNRTNLIIKPGLISALLVFLAFPNISASEGGWAIRRKGPFEFKIRPQLKKHNGKITIFFETKSFCDVTVGIENSRGHIVRHLASGLLGKNPPPPFAKGVRKQSLIWDGKNDQGRYVPDPQSLSVRVSLGLKPLFEKDLFNQPMRRHGREAPIFQASREGVYVYDGGNGLDFVELYDHKGEYKRTVYPFPADKIKAIKGLKMRKYPQDGLLLPLKPTFLQQTLLTCGNLYGYEYPAKFRLQAQPSWGSSHFGMYGNAASIFAVGGRKMALGKMYLCRLAPDGSSGGMNIEGPAVALTTIGKGIYTRGKQVAVAPRSGALSPDGKTLYLTGYNFCHYGKASRDIITSGKWEGFHCVNKINMDAEKGVELFLGSQKINKWGSDSGSFKVPTSVATDSAGRVYVADYMNDRVQIFSAAGKHLKSLGVKRPGIVSIDGKTGEIYVFTTFVHNYFMVRKPEKISPRLTVFGRFEKPAKKLSCPLPKEFGLTRSGYTYSGMGFPLSAVVDGYADLPRIWLASEWTRENVMTRGRIKYHNIKVFVLSKGKFKLEKDFGAEVAKSVKRARPAPYARPRLYFNPGNRRLYVGEGQAFGYKSFKSLIEINPRNGRKKIIQLPFDAEDMCFDHNGYAYLRTINTVVRYDSRNWREVPWDYGEQRRKTFTSSSSDRREAAVISGLPLPADGGWHHGGMSVSLKGFLAVACGYNLKPIVKNAGDAGAALVGGRKYLPKIFPGRATAGRGGAPLIHIWDKFGQLQKEDVLPGISGQTYGIALDKDNAVYLMSSATRILNGKTYVNRLSGTLMKVVPGRAKLLSRDKADIVLGPDDVPTGSPDLVGSGLGTAWARGVEWMYAGVGYDGKNAGIGCACWNARAAFDYYGRSFAPEIDRYRLAVLDSAGNLILRIGRYGNRDSAGPGSLVPLGGDEVGMTHGAYLATETDRRLFVADPANDRIFSITLGYHASEKISLKSSKPGTAPEGSQ
jgi:NHL repeat